MEDIKSIHTDDEEDMQKNISVDESADILGSIHSGYDIKIEKERFSDVIVVQIILCILIVLIFAVINIIEPEITKAFIGIFKKMSNCETEEFFKKAVVKAMNFINDKI